MFSRSILVLAALAGAFLSSPAEARRAHHHHHQQHHSRSAPAPTEVVFCNNDGRCSAHGGSFSTGVAQIASGAVVQSRYIGGRLVCAINVNAALAARGIKGTGSAMAKSFLGWGHASPPVPGAVAVYNRGGRKSRSGHVAIVSRVVGSTVYVMNPGRHGWREVAYPRQAIAYRVAS